MGGCSEPTKVTVMILKVDLDCCQCYLKVKRLLCKFPQIQNQVYDEKQNTVTITVVCCSPEKIRDKLCYKGGKSIKSIEIVEDKKHVPEKPKPKQDKPKPPPTPAPAPAPMPVPVPIPALPPPPAEPQKPKPQPPAPEPKKPSPELPCPIPVPMPQPEKPEKIKKNGSKNASRNGSKRETPPDPTPKPAEPTPPPPKPVAPTPKPVEPAPPKMPAEPEAQWVPGYPPGPPPQVFPVSVCCGPCYQGLPGGPCYEGYGPGPAPTYAYAYGRPPCPQGYYASRCDYFSEENPAACSIM